MFVLFGQECSGEAEAFFAGEYFEHGFLEGFGDEVYFFLGEGLGEFDEFVFVVVVSELQVPLVLGYEADAHFCVFVVVMDLYHGPVGVVFGFEVNFEGFFLQ